STLTISFFIRSLHDALPISPASPGLDARRVACSMCGRFPGPRPIIAHSFRLRTDESRSGCDTGMMQTGPRTGRRPIGSDSEVFRSEEHTSELQSREKLVCRL